MRSIPKLLETAARTGRQYVRDDCELYVANAWKRLGGYHGHIHRDCPSSYGDGPVSGFGY